MIYRSINLLKIQTNKRALLINLILAIQIIGLLFYYIFYTENGYLPSPFMYDKSDTFMDFFNTLYWSYDEGRYSEWKSVYPPVNFLMLKAFNCFNLVGDIGDPFHLRDESISAIFFYSIIYFLAPALLISTSTWIEFNKYEKFLIYLILIFSTPMLFAFERGNLIVLAPAIIAYMLASKRLNKSIMLALLINLKPYFVILTVSRLIKIGWPALLHTALISGLIFTITGLVLDSHFYLFFQNIFSFSKAEELFSLREVMSMPSSISAITYVLKDSAGLTFALNYLSMSVLSITVSSIEIFKWLIILTTFLILFLKSRFINENEMLLSLIAITSNLGIWVGGYSIILYAPLIPVFVSMRYKSLYMIALILLALPLDTLCFLEDNLGMSYSFVSDSVVNVYWTLGIGSFLRPFINISLLLILIIEFAQRNQKGIDDLSPRNSLTLNP